ncbi:hypothetical protein VUR80DRAFT_9513 [Thermomyces stellatus]
MRADVCTAAGWPTPCASKWRAEGPRHNITTAATSSVVVCGVRGPWSRWPRPVSACKSWSVARCKTNPHWASAGWAGLARPSRSLGSLAKIYPGKPPFPAWTWRPCQEYYMASPQGSAFQVWGAGLPGRTALAVAMRHWERAKTVPPWPAWPAPQ